MKDYYRQRCSIEVAIRDLRNIRDHLKDAGAPQARRRHVLPGAAMNATVHDIGAAARHRKWKEDEAHRAAVGAIEVREVRTREQVYRLLGREWCDLILRWAAVHGVRSAADYLRRCGHGLIIARILLLGRP